MLIGLAPDDGAGRYRAAAFPDDPAEPIGAVETVGAPELLALERAEHPRWVWATADASTRSCSAPVCGSDVATTSP